MANKIRFVTLGNGSRVAWDEFASWNYSKQAGKIWGGRNKGSTHSEETRKKMREAIRPDVTAETKKKISETLKGGTCYIHTAEHLKKISETHKGKVTSEETKKKLSEAQKGKKASAETRKKMSRSRKGRINTEESKQKCKDTIKRRYPFGYNHSEETRKKISEAVKKMHLLKKMSRRTITQIPEESRTPLDIKCHN